MRKPFASALAACLLAALPARAEDLIERKPLAIGTKIETGQIVQGEPELISGVDPDKFYISQIGINLTQEALVNRRLEIRVGVGGVFYYSFPNDRGIITAQGTKFGPGVSQAQAVYRFGDPDDSKLALRVGYFPYKYNPDAMNLGEYLFRSMPYPTFVFTGGWSIIDNAQVRVQGVQLSYKQLGGALRHDLLFTSERDFRPQGDFTPSYLAELNVGPFQFGAGASLFHYLPIQEKRVKARDMQGMTILSFADFPAFTARKSNLDSPDDPYGPVVHPGGAIRMTKSDLDNLLGESDMLNRAEANPVFSADTLINEAIRARIRDSLRRDTVTLDVRGIKLMGRASFDLQKIMPMEFLGKDAFKIYAEAALLGVENQPGFFEKRGDRIPLMFGIHLPTFRLLDMLAAELEYFPTPLPDNYKVVLDWNYPTYEDYSLLFHNSRQNRKDDWKWSVYAAKTVFTGFSLRAQVANDHFRTIDRSNYFTGKSIMRDPSNWYYIVSVNFGI
jgi:hypothetical protein